MLGHVLADVLLAAARGVFPPPDGRIHVLPPDGLYQAVLGFTAHAIVLADAAPDVVLAQLPAGDLGAALSPSFLVWLGARIGRAPGSLDCVLVRTGVPPASATDLLVRTDLDGHPRVARARHHRRAVEVFSDPQGKGLVTLGRGLAGRLELSFEVDEAHQNAGLGRRLIAGALLRVASEEPVFAQVAAANARSLRALVALGFKPIGAEVLFDSA
jgi:GNAT superfamily N-acetyltransferase